MVEESEGPRVTRKMMIKDLSKSWLQLAELFRSHADKPPAVAYERCAKELEEALREEGDRPLTLQEASRISGYSADHLGRAVREGKIPNAGRVGAPRIAYRDLPRKSDVASHPERGYFSRTQIVRSAINAGD